MIARHLIAVTVSITALAISPAAAQSVGDTTFGGGLSTFGATIEGSYQFEPQARLRGVLMGGLSYSASETDDDGNNVEIDASLGAAAAFLDYIPNDSGLRFSFGLLLDSSEISAVATGGDGTSIEVNGETFDAGEVTTTLTFDNQIAPVVTVGYDYAFNDNWILTNEIGVAYIGGFETSFSANSQELLDAVNEDVDFQQAQEDAAGVSFYPYISFGVSYRF